MKISFLTTLFAIVSFCSFAQNHPHSYLIEGNVKGINAKKVYLVTPARDLSKNTISSKTIDSAVVINDQFVLQKDTILPEPSWASAIYFIDSLSHKKTFFSFALNNTYVDSFLLDWGKIKFEGQANKAGGIKISGSKEMDFGLKYGALILHEKGYYPLLDQLDSLQKTDRIDLYQKLKKTTDSLDQLFVNQIESAAIANPDSWLALLNVYQNAKKFDYGQLQKFEQRFDPAILATPTGQKFIQFVKNFQGTQVGANFPSFSYKNANGQLVKLSQVKGKTGTLIIFWASWCGPCRAEIPNLKKLQQTYSKRGINFVSISTDEDIKNWKTALAKEKMIWPNLANLPGSGREINRKYNIDAIPSMFLIDSENKIVMADEYRDAYLVKALQSLVSQSK